LSQAQNSIVGECETNTIREILMRQFAALVLVAVALSGCAAKVISGNERMVMINAGSLDPAGAMRLAETECGKFGRHARLSAKPDEDRQWIFNCVQ
jgi:hypothetical protein